jgi:hypothetical protein
MGQPMLVFHNDSDSSYANYAGNLSSISIAATAVTLRFLGQGTSTSGTDAVVLSCAAGNEEAVLEAVAGAAAEGRSSMTIIADDKNSKYLIPEITGVTSISINTGAAHIENVIVLTDDRTLTVAESGSTVMMNHAAKVITLPPAQAGLNFKIGFYQDTTDGAKIVATAGDCFFGTLIVNSATKTKSSAQSVTHATAVATVANFDTLDFTHDSQTLAGKAGDMVEVTCTDGDAWLVSGALMTDGNDPDAIAIINAA